MQITRRALLATGLALPLVSGLPALAQRSSPRLRPLRDIVRSPIIDVHAHLAPPAWSGVAPAPPRSFTREQLAADLARNPYIEVPDPAGIVARDYDRLLRFEAARADGTMATSAAFLIAEMDAAGIDISVNNCLDEVGRPFGRPLAVPTERVLEEIAAVAARYPGRIVNFFGIDPRRGRDGIALLRRAVTEFGVCGMGEWLTHRWKVFPNDRAVAYPYLAACAELGIPYGNNGSGVDATQAPEVFADILRDFPTLKVVHQAAGLLTEAERRDHPAQADLPERLLALAEKHDNFWLDIDDWQRLDDAGRARTAKFLRRAFDGPAAGRIMFGTDFPIFTRTVSAAKFIESIVGPAAGEGGLLTERELTMLFSTNALRFLDGPRAPSFIRTAARALR